MHSVMAASDHQHAALQPGHHGAFLREGFAVGPPGQSGVGPLQGLRLAVKDVFNVIGQRTGCGNPAWLASGSPAAATAASVRLLLGAGAQWVGRTVTDELTYSLSGINAHYGTPVNPAAADRIPGGSSSGSAAAVAGGHAEIGLGTDCGGSIRLPASYCGLWGMRPTHGRITGEGCLSLAHSFDTVGWFASEGQILARVFEVLAHTRISGARVTRLLFVEDVLELLDAQVAGKFLTLPCALTSDLPMTSLPAGSLDLVEWARAFRALQAAEIWQQHGDWFALHGQSLGEDVRARFALAASVTETDVMQMQFQRLQAERKLARILEEPGCLMVVPTVPSPAPRLTDSAEFVNQGRARAQQLLCMAGLAGLPQATIPWCTVNGAPVGLSVIGGRGDDEVVLAGAQAIREQLDRTPE